MFQQKAALFNQFKITESARRTVSTSMARASMQSVAAVVEGHRGAVPL